MGAALIFGLSACTDDHFDIQSGSTPTASNTLWQNIKAMPQLSDAAEVLERSKVMSSNTDRKGSQPYSDLLNGTQEFTVWLPVNGTFDKQALLDSLDRAEELRATGVTADLNRALILDYNVSQQFARNHMARFNYESNRGSQSVRLLNGKLATYNATDSTFNSIPLYTGASSVVSSNGMLHVLTDASDFSYNVYEYFGQNPELSSLYSLISAYDQTEFSASSSTEGSMNSSGKMEYVDSVFVTRNEILSKGRLSDTSNEDSTYIAILPTNKCFDAAMDQLKKYYVYQNNYYTAYDSEKGDFTNNTASKAFAMSASERDSLQQLNASIALLRASVISTSNLPQSMRSLPAEQMLDGAMRRDSLTTIGGTLLYNKNAPDGINPMFGGNTASDYVKASNGYIFNVDEYNYDPAYSFVERQELKGSSVCYVTGCSEESYTTWLTEDNLNPAYSLDSLSAFMDDDTYYYFPVDGNNTLRIFFRLNNILSGVKYKISLCMLPNRINTANIGDAAENPKFDVAIINDKKNTINKEVKGVTFDQEHGEKVTIWDAFEFPYCFTGLPDNNESFPQLRIQMTSRYQTQGKCKALSIGKLVIEPVRE